MEYLSSLELVKELGYKLPSVLKYKFAGDANDVNANKTKLEKLTDFLYREAILVSKSAIFKSSGQVTESNGHQPIARTSKRV